ncbi:MAG: BMC domain-containing protein [Synergistaceae bacterium]|nr:BMC domain-containing protein [Candidatus Equadaptatus faecalis]MDO4952196.1 BMC domain-containing protein [Synergistaceae bacterium]
MNNAIGMVELNSIAMGIETCDFMIKASKVELLRACTICPGKYIVLVGGDVGDVRASMKEGILRAGETLVDTLLIPQVHPDLIPAVSMTTQVTELQAVGVLEYYSVASAINGGDIAAKAARVKLIEIRTGFAIGGKGFVTLTGDVGAVRASIEAASNSSDLFVHSVVIPRPDKRLFETLL